MTFNVEITLKQPLKYWRQMKSLPWSDGREKKDKAGEQVTVLSSGLVQVEQESVRLQTAGVPHCVFVKTTTFPKSPFSSYNVRQLSLDLSTFSNELPTSHFSIFIPPLKNTAISLHLELCYLSPEPDLMLRLRPWAVSDGGGSILTPSVIQITTDFSNVL